jgi:hypothetical protein
MHRKLSAPAIATLPETARLCCRRSPTATRRTTRRPLPCEADLGWERAAYLALYHNAI